MFNFTYVYVLVCRAAAAAAALGLTSRRCCIPVVCLSEESREIVHLYESVIVLFSSVPPCRPCVRAFVENERRIDMLGG